MHTPLPPAFRTALAELTTLYTIAYRETNEIRRCQVASETESRIAALWALIEAAHQNTQEPTGADELPRAA